MPDYLFEFHYRDGRIVPEPHGTYATGNVFLRTTGTRIAIDGTWWIVRDVVVEPGYAAKITLDEE